MDDETRNSIVNIIAWRDCISWAVGSQEILDRFKKETGCPVPAAAGLNALIDRACGMDKLFADKFVPWFNENIWGLDCVPDGFERKPSDKFADQLGFEELR